MPINLGNIFGAFGGGGAGGGGAGGGGAVMGQVQPAQGFAGQQQNQQFWNDQILAMQQAGRLDRAYLEQAIRNAIVMSGGQNGNDLQRASAEAARLAEMITTAAANFAPELVEQLGGRRGMAVNLARHVTEGLRFTRYGSGQAGQ